MEKTLKQVRKSLTLYNQFMQKETYAKSHVHSDPKLLTLNFHLHQLLRIQQYTTDVSRFHLKLILFEHYESHDLKTDNVEFVSAVNLTSSRLRS